MTVVADEEHNIFQLLVEDRRNGYSRAAPADGRFRDDRRVPGAAPELSRRPRVAAGPVRRHRRRRVRARGGRRRAGRRRDGPHRRGTLDERRVAAEPTARQRARVRVHDQDVRIESVDALVEFFIAAGKKGVAINRYKGLGEMNPEQLWATTMKPEERTLLQVRAEDHAEADQMFTTLMGDQVEPRRKFIEDNALDVKNLDV